jgi:pantoate--beta-alanine ligase
MQLIATVAEMRATRRVMRGPAGLVPTMGFLHEGHLSLVRASRERDDHAIVSIFVNPTQFGPNEDFDRYPRDMERDLALLRDERVDAVFAPPVEEMYPADDATFVEVAGITEVLEGAHRPGHLRGVTTVVTKLLNIVQPQRAYFGQKDAQQLLVVRRLVRDLRLDVEIIGLPIVREPDGLAMSSRNAYLAPEGRKAALALSKALHRAESIFTGGERDAGRLREEMRRLIAAEPLARIDYVSIADAETLAEIERIECPALASLAVHIGGVRLIDNVTLEP